MLASSFSGSNGTKIPLIVMMHVCTIVVVTRKCIALSSPNFSSILVFGDSTVDSGNNNYILTLNKVNHFPYGKDFPGHVPTGRFSNGKLVTDLLASYLNIKDVVPPFLDPNLSNDELVTGVCFASGGAGFDDFTLVSLGGAISMFNQLDLFKVYVTKLKGIVGEDKAKQILGDALVVICAGSNDLIVNFYNIPTRRMVFNMDMYQDFLQYRLQSFIKVNQSFIHCSFNSTTYSLFGILFSHSLISSLICFNQIIKSNKSS
ncbi:putative triacylglycerol lipase [Lupinus albus]|uniref:Putative triacylglycerol lipase n=1 Tax=Lupinus albus TaxID=3870 RepID=A0A6A4P3A4_LUPAL|nr:putative triacylglycerol lipase [Lupinus albus]